jgi:hypothetical protein
MTMKTTMLTLALALALAAAPAFAQSLEPGEWQFDTTMTMAGMAKPQTSSVQRCLKKDEAADAERWTGRQLSHSDCKLTMADKTAASARWTLECPKSGMRGTGSATIGHGTMASDQKMTGEMRGQPFEMNIKTTGKRLGPCKS